MSYRSGVVTGVLAAAVLAAAAGGVWWLLARPAGGTGKASPPPIPAAVPKTANEDAFNTVTLTPAAEERLAVRTAPVERKPVRRVRVYGGEVTIPPGQAVVVSAPVSGVLKAPPGGVPRPGQAVKAGQPVFQLVPLLTPEGRANLAASRVDADGQVKNAQTAFDAAKIALDRAKGLLRGEAGSQRMVDEAQAAFDLAQKTFEAVTARRDLLAKVLGDGESPVPLGSPADGMVRNVSARPDQSVPAGAALFEVFETATVWVRVPVYVGDLADLAAADPAAVGTLSMKPGDPTRPAKPAAAPPAANPAAGTVDLFYELDNRDAGFSPGQRVGAALPLKGEADSLTVPRAAVLYDIHGGTWVYERTADRTYARRRVVVRHVAGSDAVLAAGPPPGTPVVTAGAAELFGTETGYSK